MSTGGPWRTVDIILGDRCTLGTPIRALVREALVRSDFVDLSMSVTIGDDCIIGTSVVIHDSTSVGTACFLDDGTRIGYGCSIRDNVRLEYGAFICDKVTIGEGTVVAGFVCDRVQIGRDCIVMGSFVHELTQPHSTDWGIEESASLIGDRVVIGMGAVVVGGVSIGRGSYVCAGATITKDIPPDSVVLGVNTVVPQAVWKGRRLRFGS